jgi:hypothetical protein
MSDATERGIRERKGGDSAVDGLLAGIVAGLGMAAYLILTSLFRGISPAVILGYFDPGMVGQWLTGTLAHLAVSGVYGVVFALLLAVVVRIREPLLRFGWLIGLVYGLVLVALARGVLLPMAGSALLQISTGHLFIAHAIYGLVLGFEVSRKWSTYTSEVS